MPTSVPQLSRLKTIHQLAVGDRVLVPETGMVGTIVEAGRLFMWDTHSIHIVDAYGRDVFWSDHGRPMFRRISKG